MTLDGGESHPLNGGSRQGETILTLLLDLHRPRLWAWCQVVTVGGWVRESPSPGRTQLALELGDSGLLKSCLGEEEEQTDHLLQKEIREEQEIQTWKGQGPTKPLSQSAVPTPLMAQCWALPGGNPFTVSAIHLPGVHSTPLLIPVVLLPRDGACGWTWEAREKKQEKGGWGLVRGLGSRGLGQAPRGD